MALSPFSPQAQLLQQTPEYQAGQELRYGDVPPAAASTGPTTSSNNFGSFSSDPVIQQLLQNITSTQQQLSSAKPAAPQQIVSQFNPADFKVPDYDSLVKAAFSDPNLVKYYDNLLKENQGDVDRAKGRITQDYQQGIRYTQEDTTQQTGRTKEDLQSALDTLGVQFPQEKEKLLDSLNKRGIALTQGDNGKLNVATEGQAGTEASALTEDQQLRKEAVERNAQRNIADIGIKSQRQTESLGQTQTRGLEDVTRQQQQYGEQLNEDKLAKAQQMAGLKQQEELGKQQLAMQQKSLDIQQQQFNKQFG